jgi:quinol monooxygenase YgiN
MHIATISITPPSKKKQKIMDAFKVLGTLTEKSPGCLECSIFSGTMPGQPILVVGRWQSEEDLRRYLQSDIYRQVRELAGLSNLPPEIRFYGVIESAGLELVEKIRRLDMVSDSAEPPEQAIHSGWNGYGSEEIAR